MRFNGLAWSGHGFPTQCDLDPARLSRRRRARRTERYTVGVPGLGFSSPSADVRTVGNPALKPYVSQNLDLGVEYYTGNEGYVGIDVFRKRLTGSCSAGSGAAPAAALGVAPSTYNLTAYYEHGAVSVRLSEAFNKGSQVQPANQNGLKNPLSPNDPTAYGLFSDAYRQWDFSSSLDLSKMFGWKHQLKLTLDGLNLFGEKQRTYFQFTNATFTEYAPGRTLMFGVRGRF
jgi:outer membrane receptor protein involved in Fe transport